MNSMKTILTALVLIGITVAFPTTGNAQTSTPENTQATTDGLKNLTKEEAQAILMTYLEIKDALVATDAEAASLAANKLIEAVDQSKDAIIQGIRSDASAIAEATETELQRTHLSSLSGNVYKMLKGTGVNENPIYWEYCPMALSGKGAYWLSAEQEIKNPYFGDKMLKCGSVKEIVIKN